MQLKFHTLDVFTTQRFCGNPLAVVLDADDLSDQTMQKIATEFALSETVFVLRPKSPTHTARLRIFTPTSELPFAGHPTVGAAALLALLRTPDGGEPHDAIVVLEEAIGTIRAGVRVMAGAPAFAEFDAPKLPEHLADVAAPDRLAAALGLLNSEVGFENHRPARFTAGLPYTFVPLRNLEAVGRAIASARHWEDAFGAKGAAYIYCRETVHSTAHFHARMFDPGHGIAEDPATGSAVVAMAGVIAQFDGLPDGSHKRTIEQGYEMGRPSTLGLEITLVNRAITALRIGGHVVEVTSGMLTV